MAKNNRLLSILRVADDLLADFDSHFSQPTWVAGTLGLSTKKSQRRLNYLRRQNFVDQNYQLKQKKHQIFSLVNKKWDQKWRFVSYDIGQEDRAKRRKVRNILTKLGFKQLQRSVWVSPLAVEGYLSSFCNNNSADEFCLVVGELFADSPKKVVKSLWQVERWQKQGRKVLKRLKRKNGAKMENRKVFWDLMLKHPKVPRELLPFYWPLEDLAEEFVAKINEKKQS